jgi:hypothetical protein
VTSALRAKIKLIIIGVSSVPLLTAVAYVADYAVFRYRISANRQPFGQVTVTSYDAVAQKSGKTQFFFHPPEVQTCANALFPRAGYPPCWYLQSHSEQRTDI